MLSLASSIVNPAHRTSPLLYPSVGGWVGRVTERRAMTYGSLRRRQTEMESELWYNFWPVLHTLESFALQTHCYMASSWKPTRRSPAELLLPDWLMLGNLQHRDALMGSPRGTGSHRRLPGGSAHISWCRRKHVTMLIEMYLTLREPMLTQAQLCISVNILISFLLESYADENIIFGPDDL